MVLHYLFNELSLLTQTVISTLVILDYSRVFAKSIFQIYANSFKIIGITCVCVLSFILCFSSFVIWISDFVLKTFFKTKGDEVQLAFAKSNWAIT